MFKFLRNPSVNFVENLISTFLSSNHKNTRRVINTLVINEVITPIIRVIANPCIGPEPNIARIVPVIM